MKNDLFIDTIKLDKDKIDDFNKYPFNIKCIKNFSNIRLNKSVTFLYIRKVRFFEKKSNLCIDKHIFYKVHLSY